MLALGSALAKAAAMRPRRRVVERYIMYCVESTQQIEAFRLILLGIKQDQLSDLVE